MLVAFVYWCYRGKVVARKGYTPPSKHRPARRLLTFVVPIVVPNSDTFFYLLSKGLMVLINSAQIQSETVICNFGL